MATGDDVRRLALALPETSGRPSLGNRQWRVREKLFAAGRRRPGGVRGEGRLARAPKLAVEGRLARAPKAAVEDWLARAPKRAVDGYLSSPGARRYRP